MLSLQLLLDSREAMFDSWWESWLMWKSIDDKVEKALRTDGRTDIADSRVASRLKKKQKPFSKSCMRRNKKNLGVNVNIALNSYFKFIWNVLSYFWFVKNVFYCGLSSLYIKASMSNIRKSLPTFEDSHSKILNCIICLKHSSFPLFALK